MPRVSAEERWHFVVKDRQPVELAEAKKLADAMGLHFNTVTGVLNKGIPMGESFMAAWCAIHPLQEWSELFTLVPPGKPTKLRRFAADYAADLPRLPMNYQAASEMDLTSSDVVLDGEVHKVITFSLVAPQDCQPWGHTPGHKAGEAVRVLGYTEGGELVMYAALRLPWVQKLLAPVFDWYHFDASKINWREGSEPPSSGRLAPDRYFLSSTESEVTEPNE